MKNLYICTLCILPAIVSANVYAEQEVNGSDSDHWWSGISFTPGVGARHIGLDVIRKSDGYNGNLAQGAAAKLFWSFSITSDEYQFGATNFGLSLRLYNSSVELDHQFYDSQTVNMSTGTNEGQRIDVGTSVSGYYSYLVPAFHYKIPLVHGGSVKFALGWGLWDARFSGNIILTPDNQPFPGGEKSSISLERNRQWAYIFLMSYQGSEWLFEMTVGGPEFEDNTYEYQMEEVSIIIGKTFTL